MARSRPTTRAVEEEQSMNRTSAPSFKDGGVGVVGLAAPGRQLSRRRFLKAASRLGLGGAGLLLAGCEWAPNLARASARGARVGVLATGGSPDLPPFVALRQGLHELGYVEG